MIVLETEKKASFFSRFKSFVGVDLIVFARRIFNPLVGLVVSTAYTSWYVGCLMTLRNNGMNGDWTAGSIVFGVFVFILCGLVLTAKGLKEEK